MRIVWCSLVSFKGMQPVKYFICGTVYRYAKCFDAVKRCCQSFVSNLVKWADSLWGTACTYLVKWILEVCCKQIKGRGVVDSVEMAWWLIFRDCWNLFLLLVCKMCDPMKLKSPKYWQTPKIARSNHFLVRYVTPNKLDTIDLPDILLFTKNCRQLCRCYHITWWKDDERRQKFWGCLISYL